MATLDEIDAKLDILLAQAGSNVVTLTVVDGSGSPLAGVGMTIRSLYDNLVSVAVTNSVGVAVVLLDNATYNVYLRKTGSSIVFSNPYQLVVSGDTALTMTATAPVIASPGDPSRATVYGWVADIGLTVQEGVTVRFTLVEPNILLDSGTVLADPIDVLTDAEGRFEVALVVATDLMPSNVKYRVEIDEAFGHTGWRKSFCAECLEPGGMYRLSDLCR